MSMKPLKLEYIIDPIVKRFNHRPTAAEIIGDTGIIYQVNSINYSGYAGVLRHGPRTHGNFYGIRMEKHRKKCIKREKVSKVRIVGAGGSKNMDMTQQYVSNKYTYERAYWLVHLYVIPIPVLVAFDLCAKQRGMKTFTIEPTKRT